MTPAELRVARERLGLTGDAIAELLDVDPRTCRRWEAGTGPIPTGVERQIAEWESEAVQLSAEFAMRGQSEGVLVTYKTDENFWAHEPDRPPYPASWHRAIVGRLNLDRIRVEYAE